MTQTLQAEHPPDICLMLRVARRAALARLEGDPVAAPARGARRDRARRDRRRRSPTWKCCGSKPACVPPRPTPPPTSSRPPRGAQPTLLAEKAERYHAAVRRLRHAVDRRVRDADRSRPRDAAARRAATGPWRRSHTPCARGARASTCSRTRTNSDGVLSATEVVARAAEAGVELLALSDHDTIAGVAEAVAAGERDGVRIVPAVEISAVDDGAPTPRELHILGYGIDYTGPPMTASLEEFLADREKRTLRMRDGLREVGFDLDEAEIDERIAAGKPIGRPHLAGAVLRAPANAAAPGGRAHRRCRLADPRLPDRGQAGVPAARDADGRARRSRRSTRPAGWRSGRTRSGTSRTPTKCSSTPRALPRSGDRRRRGLLHHPRRASDAAAGGPRRGARHADDGLGRLPRAGEPPVPQLHGVRDLRHRAEPRTYF